MLESLRPPNAGWFLVYLGALQLVMGDCWLIGGVPLVILHVLMSILLEN